MRTTHDPAPVSRTVAATRFTRPSRRSPNAERTVRIDLPDEARALDPLGPTLAPPLPAQVVAGDQPGIDTGHRIAGRSGELGIDDDDRAAEHDVAETAAGDRAEALDGDRPPNRVHRDADLVGGLDQRLLVDAVDRRSAVVGQLAGPPEHPGHDVSIERLAHRRQPRDRGETARRRWSRRPAALLVRSCVAGVHLVRSLVGRRALEVGVDPFSATRPGRSGRDVLKSPSGREVLNYGTLRAQKAV